MSLHRRSPDHGGTDYSLLAILLALTLIGPASASDWSAMGSNSSAHLGFSVDYAGDVNGDGFADAIVGAEGDGTSGGAHLYLGTQDGLETTSSWDSTPMLNIAARYGYSVSSAGDVNGDGFGDVIVGAPFYANGESREGAAFLYLGGPNGPSLSSDWSFEPNNDSEYAGIAVTGIGDVNGDAYDDVAIGADQAGNNAEGAVYIFYGSQDGLAATPDLTLMGSMANGYFGNTLSSAGDVNGDGYADLAVGAYNTTNGEAAEGMVFVFHGSDTGLSSTPNWNYERDQSSAWLGSSVAGLGDVNGDGYSDLAVGASRYSEDSLRVGAAFVFQGSAAGLSDQPVWTKLGDQVESGFGVVGGMGDYNGDGYADLVVGTPGYEIEGEAKGRVSLYLGSASGIRSATSIDWIGKEDGSRFGAMVAAVGDVNADGISDLLVGAHKEDGTFSEEGTAYLFLGKIHGYKTTTTWDDKGGQGQSLFGYDLKEVGDLNGDGFTDLVVGAPYDAGVGVDSGRVEVYYGAPDGLSIARSLPLLGEKTESLFGFSLAKAGDLNGDGYSDLVVGAPEYQRGESEVGAVYVYYGTSGQSFAPTFDRLFGEQANSLFGYAVDSGGDLNGDGFFDVVVGARNFSDDQSEQGKVYVYYGGESGVNPTPAWTYKGNTEFAHLGSALEMSGDYNRDGYADLAVAAHAHSPLFTDQAAILVFHGHHSGLPDSPDWIDGAGPGTFGTDLELASVGDVTTDGFADLLVGAPSYSNGQQNEGAVHLFYGGIGGLDDADTVESDQANARLGASVTGLGDVDGNGTLDVAAGMPQATDGGVPKGKTVLWSGQPSGIEPFDFSPLVGSEANGRFGFALSGGGDFNGDGVPDLAVGAPYYDGGLSDQGRAVVYFGNDSFGIPLVLSQKDLEAEQLISPGGVADSEGFRVTGIGTNAYGRGEVKFQAEYAKYPQIFSSVPNNAQLVSGTDFSEVMAGGINLQLPIDGLNEFVAYHWRARFLYPANNPMGIQQSRWFSPTSLGPNGLHLRTRDETAPNNPTDLVETNGVPNGVWQNVTEDLYFTWSGASDPFGSGVLNYDVYWGDNPNGATPTATVTEPEFDPAPITVSFEHYLRIRTRDRQENVSDWQTFFITRYDGMAPTAPSEVDEASGASNGEWQNTVASPHFTWTGESDSGGSGIAGYEVIWST
ncbi:MAG: FG-GAP repeat protein, partial [Candidatus Omnitrophica bacterium]|nr:FG-GAP repeat protein [Candidatus Omnitrophota bacterium]